MKFAATAFGVVSLSALAATVLAGATVNVPGTSNLWLAGMPDGSVGGDGQDIAPDQSPVLAPVAVSGGTVFSFDVTGSVNNDPFEPTLTPDGDLFAFLSRTPGPENGIGDVLAPLNSLVGVFLDDAQPDGSALPDLAFDFSAEGIGINFSSLNPALKQPFFIGDGRSDDPRAVQTFVAPAGATRLYLGTMDGFGWSNNAGSFRVTIVPAPGAAAAFGLIGAARLRRRR